MPDFGRPSHGGRHSAAGSFLLVGMAALFLHWILPPLVELLEPLLLWTGIISLGIGGVLLYGDSAMSRRR